MQTVTIENLAALDTFAHTLLGAVTPTSGATIFALSGDLGAGKTALVQAIGRALEVIETITSPTFLVMRRYALPAGGHFSALVHIDAYRVEDPEELSVLGFSEIVKEPVLMCIEWPERVGALLPTENVMHISLVSNPDDSRTITYGKS